MNKKDKIKEWYRLVGEKRFLSLDKKSRDFLIKTAGIIDFEYPIDIKEAYQYPRDYK